MAIATADAPGRVPPISRLWRRELDAYPDNGPRFAYLGLVVLATVVLYYELYIGGAVGITIIEKLHMSLTYLVFVSVVGNAVGALGSVLAGLADRWGRANIVVGGLVIAGALTAFAVPAVTTKGGYMLVVAVISLVEGTVLVATPALIRDFSPQLGRATAMGFWTIGPVVGSLVVTEVTSHTLASHPDWQYQFRLCGIVGLVVAAIAAVGLRELAPGLRDQLMVSLRDRALIEARARGLDVDKVLEGQWRQMLRGDILLSAFAISVFLLFYYILVGLAVIYLATTFGYSAARANSLMNWYWIANAVTLVVTGVASDRLGVRKPFMLVGSVIAAGGTIAWAVFATQPHTSYYTFAITLVIGALGGGMAYCAWMAGFTETVERHNPAATATGLAVWGSLLRTVVTVSVIAFTFVVTAANVLVIQGSRLQTIAATATGNLVSAGVSPATAAQLVTSPQDKALQVKAVAEITHGKASPADVAALGAIDPATSKALAANPADPAAAVTALSELSGVDAATVGQVVTFSRMHPDVVATLQTVPPADLIALQANPADTAAGTDAVTALVTKLGLTPAAAQQRLLDLAAQPVGALTAVVLSGAKVAAAGTLLSTKAAAVGAAVASLSAAAAKTPAADTAYAAANIAKVRQAQKDNARQWQHWWLVCVLGALFFIPTVFVAHGRWSPRKARADARAHQSLVDMELAQLSGQTLAPTQRSTSSAPEVVRPPVGSG